MKKSENAFKHKCYLGQLFRYGYFVSGLLIASVIATLAVALVKLDIISAINSVKNLKLFLIIAVGVISLFVVIYLLAKIRCKRLCIADSIGIAIVLVGIAATALIFIKTDYQNIGKNDIISMIIGVVILVLGLTYFFFRMAFFVKHERRSIIYIKNSVTSYFSVIGQKYSFASVLLCGLVLCSLSYIALTSSYANLIVIQFINNRPFSIVMGFAIVCLILYCIIQASEKNVNPVDLLICSGVIFFPITIVNSIILKENYVRSLTFIALLLALYLMLLIVRLMSFDVTVINKPKNRRTFSEVILSITVSALILAGAILVYQTNALRNSFAVLGQIENVHCVLFFPVLNITLTAGIALIFNFVISFVNINSEKRTSGDTLSDASFITSIFGFAFLAFESSFTSILAIVGWFLINLMLFIARQRRLKENRK